MKGREFNILKQTGNVQPELACLSLPLQNIQRGQLRYANQNVNNPCCYNFNLETR